MRALRDSAALGVAMVSIQAGNAIATVLFPRVGTNGAVALRLLLGGVILALVTRRRLHMPGPRALLVIVPLGLVVAFQLMASYGAIDRLGLGTAMTVAFLGPLGLGILHRRERASAVLPLLALAGVVLVLQPDGAGVSDGQGLALGLLSAVLWAVYIVLARRLDPFGLHGTGIALAMLVAGVAALPAGLAAAGTELFHLEVLALGLACAFLCTAIGQALEIRTLPRLSPRIYGVLVSFEPALAALVGVAFLAEAMSAWQWIGVLCVVTACAGVLSAPPPTLAAPALSSKGQEGRIASRDPDVFNDIRHS